MGHAGLSTTTCLICGTPVEPWFRRGDRHLVRCPGCGLVHVPEGVALTPEGVSIYEAENNIFLADGNEGYYFDHEMNLRSCRLKLDWVAHDLADGARLCDAGSNFGHFLKVARERFDAEGFDVSPSAVAWGREHLGVPSIVASVYALPERLRGRYDAVTCWDVLEHLPDPLTALAELRALLRPAGRLFLSTPDAGSLSARLLGRHWHYIDPLQHITLFSRANLCRLLVRTGFEVLRIATTGHHYRLRYIFDRLAYLHPRGPLGSLTAAGRKVMGRRLQAAVYLNLGDVMIVTAVRRD